MLQSIKATTFGSLVIAICFFSVSCGNSNQPKNTKEQAEENNEAKFKTDASEDNAEFVMKAYSSGLCEIEKAKHAKQKAVTADVKKIADQMISAHEKLNAELKALAASEQISVQEMLTEEQVEDIKDADKKEGVDYDKAYISKLVSKHKDAVDLYEKASEKATDPEVKNYFSSNLPEIKHHLAMAEGVEKIIK